MNTSSDIPRRKIEELISLYSLEPTIRDVFVEGPTDQRIFRWFIDSVLTANNSIGIYAIDEVDIRSQLVTKHGLTPGNRSEVIVLFHELEGTYKLSSTQATGIIDRDLSDALPDSYIPPHVLKTDYSCLESYIFSPENLTKLTTLSFNKAQAAKIITSIGPILRRLFAIRISNQRLKTKLEWIDFSSYIKVEKDKLEFRSDAFIREYFIKNLTSVTLAEFKQDVEATLQSLPVDIKKTLNGHDAIIVLGIYLRSLYKKTEDTDRTKPHVLCHIMQHCMSTSNLRTESLFSTLLNRLA